jgi:NAD(P)-dependent dehydrogenase (short-subunit alcohol dehydrogenase family)
LVIQTISVFHALAHFACKLSGKIDILGNNASISEPSDFLNKKEDNWDRVIQNNLKSVFCFCKEAVPHMIKQKKGKTINSSSINGALGAKETAHYNAAKAGVESLTKSLLARELGPYHILVNAILPSSTDTKMLSSMPDIQKQKLVRRIPLKRLGNPEDCIWPVLFLSSDGSNYITDQIIYINRNF